MHKNLHGTVQQWTLTHSFIMLKNIQTYLNTLRVIKYVWLFFYIEHKTVRRNIPVLLASVKITIFMSGYMGATFYNCNCWILVDISVVGVLEDWVCEITFRLVLRCRKKPNLWLIFPFTDLPGKTRKESYRNIGWRAAEKI